MRCVLKRFFKFYKHRDVIRNTLIEPRDFKPIVKVFFGVYGSSKTRDAVDTFGDEDYYMWGPEQGKWDGYSGAKKVIVDEFRGQVPLGYITSFLLVHSHLTSTAQCMSFAIYFGRAGADLPVD